MRAPYRGEGVIGALLDDRAERFGDERFVIAREGDLTFAELRDRAQRVAGALAELGVEPGDRVATMLDPSTDYLAAWFGIVWRGAVDVPVNTAFKGDFLEHVLASSGATALVIDARWLSRLDPLSAPNLRQVVVVGSADAQPPEARRATAFDELLAHQPAARTPRTERDLAYIMCTSGTTGRSKGVVHSNRSALWNSTSWIDILELSPDDIAYSMFPLFHVTARSAVVTSSLVAGAQVVLRDGFSLSSFWADVRATGATWFGYMGAVIQLLWKQEPRDDDADNRLRVAFGAAAPPGVVDVFEQRFGVELLETYGSTELGPATAPRPGRVKRGTMGRPCPHLVVEIHDEQDRRVAPGVAGEIVARPAVPEGMFRGYWGQPEATLEAFRNLWFHTGDGGYFDEEGYLVFTDRIKDSLRRRGENISSFELERAVQAHDAVLECAAYAVPSELTEDEVMVAVVPVPGSALDVDDLLRFCVERLPRFMVPRYVRVLGALPKTPSQRVQKYLLRSEGVTADTVDREALGVIVPRD